MMPPKPDLRKGDKVQLRYCPRYGKFETHTARVTGEPHLGRGEVWEIPVKYDCIGSNSALVPLEDLVLLKKGIRSLQMQEHTPWYATAKAVTTYIIIGAVIVLFMIISGILGSYNNTYVAKNQQVATAQSNISKEEQRRVDLFNNLVDAVQSAKKFEQSTQTQIAEARSKGNGGDINGAMVTINAVTEAYPEIKSVDLYKQTMLEFSQTENRLAQYREQFNGDVSNFNNYVQGWPNTLFLTIIGKDLTPKKQLDFKVNNAEARNMFDE